MTTDEQAMECHRMLQNIAGAAPDELITQSRFWLADDRRGDLARAVSHAVLTQRLALSDGDAALLAQLLADAGADPAALMTVEPTDLDPAAMHGFAPTRVQTEALVASAASGEPPQVSLTHSGDPEDAVDQAVIASATRESDTLGLWRAWRFPGDGAPWPPPRRVYVLEAGPHADLIGITARTQAALIEAGESAPQVEVYPLGAQLPQYQRMARGYGGLLWSRAADTGIQIAVLFDEVDPETGPKMNADHPVVEGEELDKLIGYLRRGEALLVTTARMDDVVDPSQTSAVPMNFLTDGHWIWTDATTYYLERYALRPDPELVEHIRARDYRVGEVDGAAIHRALSVLQEPSDEEPAWTYG